MVSLVSIHLPKTAGTTFRNALVSVYGNKVLPDYGPAPLKDEQFEDMEVVHGHFPVWRFTKRFPDARYVMWVRDPADRIISMYKHFKRVPLDPHNGVHKRVLEEDISFSEFAAIDKVRSEWHAKYCGLQNLNRLYFIGVMEHFEQDYLELSKRLGWPKVHFQSENRAPESKRDSITIAEEERKAVVSLLSDDYRVYEEILNRRQADIDAGMREFY